MFPKIFSVLASFVSCKIFSQKDISNFQVFGPVLIPNNPWPNNPITCDPTVGLSPPLKNPFSLTSSLLGCQSATSLQTNMSPSFFYYFFFLSFIWSLCFPLICFWWSRVDFFFVVLFLFTLKSFRCFFFFFLKRNWEVYCARVDLLKNAFFVKEFICDFF